MKKKSFWKFKSPRPAATVEEREGLPDTAAQEGSSSAQLNPPAAEALPVTPRKPSYALIRHVLRLIANSDQGASFKGGEVSPERFRQTYDSSVRNLSIQLDPAEHEQLFKTIQAEVDGYGPLQELFDDPSISDIMVNGHQDVWIDRKGKLTKQSHAYFEDDAHLMRILTRIVTSRGKQINEATPFVDLQLKDGSRLHAMIPPVSNFPIIAVRRWTHELFTIDDLCGLGTMSEETAQYLIKAVQSGVNVLISGGASAGKSTLLNILASHIPHQERVVTIEQTKELQIDHPHVLSLEGQTPNVEGMGEISLQSLLKSALRLRADRIIVGEVRGQEVFEMVQAMSVGHQGSMATIHANSPKDALRRVEMLTLMGATQMTSEVVRELVYSAIELLVHIERDSDGCRRVKYVFEHYDAGSEWKMRTIYAHDSQGEGDAV